jgi:hypothetical protein
VLGVQRRIDSGRQIHPAVEIFSQNPNRQEEDAQHRQKEGDIFKLSPDDNGPLRVHDVVHDGPKEASDAEGEEKDEGEKPGIAELHRRSKRANNAEDESHDANQSTEE